ncbi:G-protein coupled receptor 157-like isoform X1 [Watersipora subatra]|uniref:G-protein coupled receptor 157-like isoform X1 n=1 Tax=Watersipora subatra TaxID=2589382 RepID=UPI00355BA55D
MFQKKEQDSLCSYMQGDAGFNHTLDLTTNCFLKDSAEGNHDISYTETESGCIIQLTYIILTAFMSVLSVIGPIIYMCCYCTMPRLFNNLRKLLLCLFICDMMVAIGNLLGILWLIIYKPIETDSICVAQAVISTGFSLAGVLWIFWIAVNILLAVIYNSQVLTERFNWLLHLTSWFIPVTIVVLGLINHRFGYNPCLDMIWWCWITPLPNDKPGLVFFWQLISVKGWEIIAYICVLTIYCIVKCWLYRLNIAHREEAEANHQREDNNRSIQEFRNYYNAQKKLLYIPLVFILGSIWGTLRFLLDFEKSTERIGDYIAILQGVGDSSQGFLNFMVIVIATPQLRDAFRMWCRRHFSTHRVRLEEDNEDLPRGDNSDADSDTDLITDHSVEED